MEKGLRKVLGICRDIHRYGKANNNYIVISKNRFIFNIGM